MKWLGIGTVLLLVMLAATKPNEAAFRAHTALVFEKERGAAFDRGEFGNWVGTMVVGAVRSERYQDQLVMARHTVSVGEKPFMQCFGIFNQISCEFKS